MSGFSAAWLNLREPADRAARNVELRYRVAAWAVQRQSSRQAPLCIADLGAGTGSTLRWLAPELPGSQQWLLVDHDAELLATLPRHLRAWAQARGRRWRSMEQGGVVDDHVRIAWRALDLARDSDRLPWHGLDLITTSALLDLVSADWLDRLVARCAEQRIALYCTLDFDGELSWKPALPGDQRMRELFACHQRGDKGFGPALGPEATAGLVRRLEGLGYRVACARSLWRLDRKRMALQQALLAGYRQVVDDLAPNDPELRDWWMRREALLPESIHRVGHRDVFAWWP